MFGSLGAWAPPLPALPTGTLAVPAVAVGADEPAGVPLVSGGVLAEDSPLPAAALGEVGAAPAVCMVVGAAGAVCVEAPGVASVCELGVELQPVSSVSATSV